MSKYSHWAAAAYAKKYALSPNPSYTLFGNDCTNFVSQCMLAGGWTMVGGSFWDRKDNDVWWYGESSLSDASYTWGGAHNFSKFLGVSGRGAITARSNLAVGDVVQIANGGHVFHTMIITMAGVCNKDGDGPFMSYHTTNTLNKDLGTIEASYPAADGYSFLYWKVKDTF